MGRSINSTTLSKESVLAKISQVSIFSTYLNISDKIIKHCINTGELICSPIREDTHPTCGFRYDNKGRLKFRDFAGYFWGDCFDLVGYIMAKMYHKQYKTSDKDDFVKILRHIALTFKDIFYGSKKDINIINGINNTILNIRKEKPIIELVIRPWNNYDKLYWEQFGIPLSLLNINFIYPIDQYYINRKINPQPKYYYNTEDPCYGYLLGQDRSGIYNIKIYFPNRKKSSTRFITNCNHLEGIYNLDKDNYDIIIITKSTKDRLSINAALNKILPLYNKLNNISIGVINIPHENYRLRQFEYDWLHAKLKDDGKIVSLMDNDNTGKLETIWLRRNYNIIPLIIPTKYNAKDFAELVNRNKSKTIKELIINTIDYIQSYNGTSIYRK